MFQTEIIHALQSFASGPLTALMAAVTYLGYGGAFFVLGVVVLFGVDFRKGYVLVQVLLWNALVLYFCKHHAALPRPSAVDPSVRLLGGEAAVPAPFDPPGAPGFWDALPEAAVARHRALAAPSHGFPSGHVSTTVAAWGTLALLFRRRWLYGTAAVLALLMPLSRMYLGSHFLADVLGGLALGAVLLAVAYVAALHRDRLPHVLAALGRPGAAWRVALRIGLPLLLVFVPGVRVEDAARLFGLGLGFHLVARTGVPVWTDGPAWRAARVLSAVVLYAGAGFVLRQAGVLFFGGDVPAWSFAAEAAGIAVMVWGGAKVRRGAVRPRGGAARRKGGAGG